MLRSADAKEDLEDVARECVQETRCLFLLASGRIKCHLDELTDRHCGEQGTRWWLLWEWHSHRVEVLGHKGVGEPQCPEDSGQQWRP